MSRHRDPGWRQFEVVILARILGPAMVLLDPVADDDQPSATAVMDKYYVSGHHVQESRYHGGASDERYLEYRSYAKRTVLGNE